MNHKKLITLLAGITLGVTGLTTVVTNTSQPVQAVYYRGAKVTTPKSIRGTWYARSSFNTYTNNYLRKIKITSHTITLYKTDKDSPHGTFTLYRQNNKIYKRVAGHPKYYSKACKYTYKHHWAVAWNFSYKGKDYLGFDPFWLDAGDNDYGGGLRATTLDIDGIMVKQLILKNPNSTSYFYESESYMNLVERMNK